MADGLMSRIANQLDSLDLTIHTNPPPAVHFGGKFATGFYQAVQRRDADAGRPKAECRAEVARFRFDRVQAAVSRVEAQVPGGRARQLSKANLPIRLSGALTASRVRMLIPNFESVQLLATPIPDGT